MFFYGRFVSLLPYSVAFGMVHGVNPVALHWNTLTRVPISAFLSAKAFAPEQPNAVSLFVFGVGTVL